MGTKSGIRKVIFSVMGILLLSGCKTLLMTVKTQDIKQNDNIQVEVSAGDKASLTRLEYKINEVQHVEQNATPGQINVPKQVTYDSAKTTGNYNTKLKIEGKAQWGTSTRTFGPQEFDLTTGKNTREDNDKTYAIYIAHDSEDREDLRIAMANAFQDEISSLNESEYLWALPSFYTTNSFVHANSVDMVISLGHGNKHCYKAGKNDADWVYTTNMEFGNMAPEHHTGDLEYLVFGSCQTLNMEDTASYLLSAGSGWGEDNYATWIAFGNVDNDPELEVGITRNAGGNARYWVLDDAKHNFAELFHGGNSWGDGNYATCIAFGDVDNDGKDEVGVTRKAGSNARYWVFDDGTHNFAELFHGGNSWGDSNYATSIAFGNVDNDPELEVGVTRKAGSNARYWVFDDANHQFNELHHGGNSWGDSNYATCIAFGDVDNDGKAEVGVTRKAGDNARYWVLDDATHQFNELHHGGNSWGDDNYATSISFGNVDNDGAMEVGVTRKAGSNARYWVLDDSAHGFAELLHGGNSWGSGNYATSIAFGDIDNDGRDEVGVARKSGGNARFWLFEDKVGGFATRHTGGTAWGEDNYATCIAFGDVNNDGLEEVGLTRNAGSNDRYYVFGGNAADPSCFGIGYKYWWYHADQTKLNKRPFTGLHMALGFRTNHRIVHWFLDNDSADFFEAFAENLDDGMSVRSAWLEATDDELSFDEGKNRTAVFYLGQYENDTINSTKDDVVYGNSEYNKQWSEYYE